MGGLDLLLNQAYAGRNGHLAVRHRARRATIEQPGPQLTLLSSGETDDPLRLVGMKLNQGESLKDRVVHARGHIRPLLGTRPCLPLDDEVSRDPQPPRPEDNNDGGNDQDSATNRAE